MKSGTGIVREHFERIITGAPKRQKNLKRLREYAFKGVFNFAEVLSLGSELLEKNLEDSMKVIIEIIGKAPSTIKGSGDQRITEAICRIMAALVACGSRDNKAFLSPLEKFLSSFRPKKGNELFLVFSEGIQGPIKSYQVFKGDEDETIFKIISDMKGEEFGISVVSESGESIFASDEDLERDFNLSSVMRDKIKEQEEDLLNLKRKSWEEIQENRRYGIRAGGRDKILISDRDPVRELNIEFLRFVQEVAEPPAVGIEVILKNKKIALGKINREGQLLVPWQKVYPEAASLLHTATLLYLRDLTVGSEDSFLRVRRTRKVSEAGEISSQREVKEYLVAREEIDYIPRHYITSRHGEKVRKIARRPRRIRFRREHIRWLPSGWEASREAEARAEKAGYNLLPGQTYVREYVSDKTSKEQKGPEKLLKDISAAKELGKALNL